MVDEEGKVKSRQHSKIINPIYCTFLLFISSAVMRFQMSWQFESWSREERDIANSSESTIFWAALVGAQVSWTVLASVSLFR